MIIESKDTGHQITFLKAFLKLTEPDISFALKTCHERDVQRILMVPFFLFDARHVKEDIPTMVEASHKLFPEIRFELMAAVGVDDRFVQVVVERLRATRYRQDAGILLLGRGNQEKSAQRSFERVAEKVRDLAGVSHLEVGYLAGTGQYWGNVLDAMVQSGMTQIVIQPYLWFHGWLTEQLPVWIADWQSSYPHVQIYFGAPMGTHVALVDAMVNRVRSSLQRNAYIIKTW